MVNRKNAEQIQEEILSCLKDGPKSIKRLSELTESTWATINTHLDSLKKEGKVREILSVNNMRVFIRADYPVFYGLPLDKEKRNNCLYVLSRVIELWKKKKGQVPNKTTIQKIAVEIAKQEPSLNLPVVRFHYGRTLPVSFEPQNNIQVLSEYEVMAPENAKEIDKKIIHQIEHGGHTNIAWQEKKKQYISYSDMKIYLFKDNLEYSSYKFDSFTEKSEEIMNNFFLEIPSNSRYSYYFEKYHDFISITRFIINSKEFESNKQQYIKEIMDVFSSIWQSLTSMFFFEDFGSQKDNELDEIQKNLEKNKSELDSFNIEDKLSDLLSYKNSLTLKEKKLNETEKKIMEILLEGADEE